MTAYDAILGHERQIAQLERARLAGKVAHAYLFYGPDGVGKELLAVTFAKALNCTDAGREPCDQCASCRKISSGNHPDVRLVASEQGLIDREVAEKKGRGVPSRQIRNEQIDELAALFRHRPYLGRFKVVIVADAQQMNDHCQNRFLKTLEEPSPDSVILMVTAQPEALLSTVRSRCQSLSFGALARGRIATFLVERNELDAKSAKVFAAMAQGSLGRAQALVTGNILPLRDSIADVTVRISECDLEDLLSAAESHGRDRSTLLQALELLELWCRDMLFVRLGAPTEMLVNIDRADHLQESVGRTTPRRLMRWIESIRRTRDSQRVNANPRLAMESLLLAMRAV
jgi:DNA polymerase III subunit delta'